MPPLVALPLELMPPVDPVPEPMLPLELVPPLAVSPVVPFVVPLPVVLPVPIPLVPPAPIPLVPPAPVVSPVVPVLDEAELDPVPGDPGVLVADDVDDDDGLLVVSARLSRWQPAIVRASATLAAIQSSLVMYSPLEV